MPWTQTLPSRGLSWALRHRPGLLRSASVIRQLATVCSPVGMATGPAGGYVPFRLHGHSSAGTQLSGLSEATTVRVRAVVAPGAW